MHALQSIEYSLQCCWKWDGASLALKWVRPVGEKICRSFSGISYNVVIVITVEVLALVCTCLKMAYRYGLRFP